jgi:hypothetical protein
VFSIEAELLAECLDELGDLGLYSAYVAVDEYDQLMLAWEMAERIRRGT